MASMLDQTVGFLQLAVAAAALMVALQGRLSNQWEVALLVFAHERCKAQCFDTDFLASSRAARTGCHSAPLVGAQWPISHLQLRLGLAANLRRSLWIALEGQAKGLEDP